MKRFIKILIPILLSVAIVASIGWYLCEYDTEFTRDQLVKLARRFEAEGDQSMAIRLYGMAYEQSDREDSVAVELAELFRSSGNYTKAEYTLSNAIADGGSLELYIALCSIYVEQDKLMDAVNMLDSVSDPVIKAQLDSMRPSDPVAVPEPGEYSEYISVSFQTGGKVYATANGEYPSVANGPTVAPFVLSGGHTQVQAVIVGENGLVSSLKTFDYTVLGVVEPVTIYDSAIDSTLRQLLQKDENHTFYSDELWEVTSLIVPAEAETLNDLKWLPNLEQVTIRSGKIATLEPLKNLTNLSDLVIDKMALSSHELAFIAAIPRLSSLSLTDCELSSISELAPAVNLTWLDLSGNTIGNISVLAGMEELEYVDLSHNALTSLEVFGGKTKLMELRASYNSIASLEGLTDCPALQVLDLTGNQLTDLEGIAQLPDLRSLSMAFNQLTDVSDLAACTLLGELDISNNQITDITGLSTLSELVHFNFSYNQVTQMPGFASDCPLVSIKGSSNQLTSLEQLRGLRKLNYVYMDHNAGLTSIAPLVECYQLVEVSVYGTSISDVSLLTNSVDGYDRNIIVFYSPIPVS